MATAHRYFTSFARVERVKWEKYEQRMAYRLSRATPNRLLLSKQNYSIYFTGSRYRYWARDDQFIGTINHRIVAVSDTELTRNSLFCCFHKTFRHRAPSLALCDRPNFHYYLSSYIYFFSYSFAFYCIYTYLEKFSRCPSYRSTHKFRLSNSLMRKTHFENFNVTVTLIIFYLKTNLRREIIKMAQNNSIKTSWY